MSQPRRVDQNALRTNQVFIIALLLIAFVGNIVPLVAFIAAVMLIGALYPAARLFVLIYQHALKPSGLVKPDVIEDNPEPHRFAMLLGGIFSMLATLSLIVGWSAIGWALALLVVFLAGLNLFVGFCAGCFMYYQLNRFGVAGFDRAPLANPNQKVG